VIIINDIGNGIKVLPNILPLIYLGLANQVTWEIKLGVILSCIDIVCTNRSYLYKNLFTNDKCITCSFALSHRNISEISKQIIVVQWHQSLLYIFISRTYQKMCLVQHVNIVTCLFLNEGRQHKIC